MKREFGNTFLLGILSILFFLIILGILNIISDNVSNLTFQLIVEFLNQNILFIILISIVMTLGNIFEILIFPFNLVYPLFNAIGGVLWVGFIFRIFGLIDTLINENISSAFAPFYPWTIFFVFLLVLFFGYLHILFDLNLRKSVERQRKKDRVEWEDVGNEFKEAFYNLAGAVKRKFEPEKIKGKSKKKKN